MSTRARVRPASWWIVSWLKAQAGKSSTQGLKGAGVGEGAAVMVRSRVCKSQLAVAHPRACINKSLTPQNSESSTSNGNLIAIFPLSFHGEGLGWTHRHLIPGAVPRKPLATGAHGALLLVTPCQEPLAALEDRAD